MWSRSFFSLLVFGMAASPQWAGGQEGADAPTRASFGRADVNAGFPMSYEATAEAADSQDRNMRRLVEDKLIFEKLLSDELRRLYSVRAFRGAGQEYSAYLTPLVGLHQLKNDLPQEDAKTEAVWVDFTWPRPEIELHGVLLEEHGLVVQATVPPPAEPAPEGKADEHKPQAECPYLQMSAWERAAFDLKIAPDAAVHCETCHDQVDSEESLLGLDWHLDPSAKATKKKSASAGMLAAPSASTRLDDAIQRQNLNFTLVSVTDRPRPTKAELVSELLGFLAENGRHVRLGPKQNISIVLRFEATAFEQPQSTRASTTPATSATKPTDEAGGYGGMSGGAMGMGEYGDSGMMSGMEMMGETGAMYGYGRTGEEKKDELSGDLALKSGKTEEAVRKYNEAAWAIFRRFEEMKKSAGEQHPEVKNLREALLRLLGKRLQAQVIGGKLNDAQTTMEVIQRLAPKDAPAESGTQSAAATAAERGVWTLEITVTKAELDEALRPQGETAAETTGERPAEREHVEEVVRQQDRADAVARLREVATVREIKLVPLKPTSAAGRPTGPAAQGVVLAVEKETEFVEVSLGIDDGLKPGDRLRVLDPLQGLDRMRSGYRKPRGVLEVVFVRSDRAVARIVESDGELTKGDVVVPASAAEPEAESTGSTDSSG